MDFWIHDICATGLTFRESFSSWARHNTSESASFHIIRAVPDINRQRANEAINYYMLTLQLPDHELACIFSCSICERTLSTGEKEINGVVMDGTAVGILGALPKFQRVKHEIPSVNGISAYQYLMKTPIFRAFVDQMFCSGYSSLGEPSINVTLNSKLWRNMYKLVNEFFSSVGTVSSETITAARYIGSFIRLENTLGVVCNESDGSMDDQPLIRGNLSLVWKSNSIELQRTCIEFGRCFISGSVAAASLRNREYYAKARELIDALKRFSLCAHDTNDCPSRKACNDCSMNLHNLCVASEDILPSACRLCRAVAKSSILGTNDDLKSLADSIVVLLKECVEVRRDYFEKFQTQQNGSVRVSNQEFRVGNQLNTEPKSNWIKEACRTGEIFPDRPEIRPRLDFFRSSRTENRRTCKKSYQASNTHALGLFTVQCVCKNPKLFGVSVMMECEGISTALSVLLSRFGRLPKNCYYDNACNMGRSIVLRVPWVNDEFNIVYDRFHYRGHLCNSVWDPDSYRSCSTHVSSGEESINRLWSLTKAHLQYVNPENLMPFSAIRCIFINVRSMLRERTRKQDISEDEFNRFVRTQWDCECSRCQLLVPINQTS